MYRLLMYVSLMVPHLYMRKTKENTYIIIMILLYYFIHFYQSIKENIAHISILLCVCMCTNMGWTFGQ